MIPTIAEIIHGLIEKTISGTQAHAWIEQHLALAHESPVRTISEDEFRNELRDQFAAQALQGLLASGMAHMDIAPLSYKYADAMLKAREA